MFCFKFKIPGRILSETIIGYLFSHKHRQLEKLGDFLRFQQIIKPTHSTVTTRKRPSGEGVGQKTPSGQLLH